MEVTARESHIKRFRAIVIKGPHFKEKSRSLHLMCRGEVGVTLNTRRESDTIN